MEVKSVLDLIVFLQTKQKAYYFLERIDGLMRETNNDSRQSYIESNFISEELRFIPNNPQTVNHELNRLYNEVKSTPLLEVVTAIKPSYATERSIIQTLHNALQEAFFVDWKEQPDLISGAIIRYKGKQYDESLKKLLQNKFIV